jgi:ethanolamine ammonia-lyase small subunit
MGSNSRLEDSPDPWNGLRLLTAARIALGRAGGSLPTREWLDFSLAHARARDAVWRPFDAADFSSRLSGVGFESIVARSAVRDRQEYLLRPDLGRRLASGEPDRLIAQIPAEPTLVIVVSDGLSALAAERQVAPLLTSLLPLLSGEGWTIAPVVVVPFARVALADEIGGLLRAELALVLLGERPGLGAPDSLGAYLVYRPGPQNTDAQRNCVSNIRSGGLPPETAAATLRYLLTESRRRKLSGVDLKDERALAGPNESAKLPEA